MHPGKRVAPMQDALFLKGKCGVQPNTSTRDLSSHLMKMEVSAVMKMIIALYGPNLGNAKAILST